MKPENQYGIYVTKHRIGSRSFIGYETNKKTAFETAKIYADKVTRLVEIETNGFLLAYSHFGSKFKWKEGHGI